MSERRELVSVTCPAPDCDAGDDDKALVIRDVTMRLALKRRDQHLRHRHPGFEPPKGSIQSRVPRLD